MSWRSECQTEQYFSRDSAMARSTLSGATSPVHLEAQVDAHEAMRIFRRALRAQVRAQPPQRLPSALQDVHHVHGHAAGEGQGEGLNRRRPGRAVASRRPPAPGPRGRGSGGRRPRSARLSIGGLPSANLALHRHQPLDPLLQRRVRAEEAAEGPSRERVHDEEVRGGGLHVVQRDALGRAPGACASALRQPVRVADEARARSRPRRTRASGSPPSGSAWRRWVRGSCTTRAASGLPPSSSAAPAPRS